MRRRLLAFAILLALLAGAAGAFVLYRIHQGRNIHGSTVEFTPTTVPKRTPNELKVVPWPLFGYTATGDRFASGIHTVRLSLRN